MPANRQTAMDRAIRGETYVDIAIPMYVSPVPMLVYANNVFSTNFVKTIRQIKKNYKFLFNLKYCNIYSISNFVSYKNQK